MLKISGQVYFKLQSQLERKMNRPKVGIGVLIVNNKNEILLGLRKSKHGHASWGPPGGHLEFMETFEICAIREVYEETGLTITNPEFFALSNDVFESDKHYVSIFMKANYQENQRVQNIEPHNFEKWQWFEINHLPNNLFLPLKQLVNNKAYGIKIHELGSVDIYFSHK